jgi:nucleotide-binding universal stress UspA family protein
MPGEPLTLVVGYDDSHFARVAVATAARSAGGGRLVVVHAHEAAPPRVTARWQELLQADAAERSRRLLADLPHREIAGLEDVGLEVRSEDGEPAEALERVAAEVGADAIVVGSRGLGEAGATVGSVSEALLRVADRPVLVIPPRRGQP